MSVKMKSIFRTTLLLCLLLVCGQAMAQTTAKGTVVDATGEPVIGATVVEKGNPKNAAVTDFDGNFTLKLQKSKTIVVSYIGMVTQEVNATGGDLSITLQDDNASLEEVVVVGYTSKARKDLTGSVGSISGAKLAAVPVTSAAVALQGKISGVQVTTVDGKSHEITFKGTWSNSSGMSSGASGSKLGTSTTIYIVDTMYFDAGNGTMDVGVKNK